MSSCRCVWWVFYLIFKPSLQCLFLLKKFPFFAICFMDFAMAAKWKFATSLHQLHLKLSEKWWWLKHFQLMAAASFKLLQCLALLCVVGKFFNFNTKVCRKFFYEMFTWKCFRASPTHTQIDQKKNTHKMMGTHNNLITIMNKYQKCQSKYSGCLSLWL